MTSHPKRPRDPNQLAGLVDRLGQAKSQPAELQPSHCHRRAQIKMGRPGRKDQAASIGGLVEVL